MADASVEIPMRSVMMTICSYYSLEMPMQHFPPQMRLKSWLQSSGK
jgi:hypothetical protein